MNLPGNRKLETTWVILGAILAVNLLLKVRFFSGLTQADDFAYGVYAFSFFRIPLPWDMTLDFRALRLALLLPVSFLFRLVPPGEIAAVLYPTVASFGTVVLVFLIGRKLAELLRGFSRRERVRFFPVM